MFDVLNVKQLGINFRVMEKQGKKDVKNSVLHRRPYEWRFYFLPPPYNISVLGSGESYTGCPRRNVRDFGRVFLMLNYTNITQNTYIRS